MLKNKIAPIPGIAGVAEVSDKIAPIPGIADATPQAFDYTHSLGFSHKTVNFKDVQDSTKLELMANAGAYSTIKAIGTGLAATSNPVGMLLGGIAYLGSEGYAFAKSATLANDEDAFWTKHFEMINEVVAEKGTMGDMLAGFSHGSSFFTGASTPEEVKVVAESGGFLAGDIVGMLTRDFTMMAIGAGTMKHAGTAVTKARTALSKAEAMVAEAGKARTVTHLQGVADAEQALATAMSVSAQTGSNMGFVAGASISNALNTATDSYANDGGVINALRNGFSHGAATGITGHFFLNKFAGAMKKVMPKLLDTTVGASIKTGAEFSAWGLGEEVLDATMVNFLGGDKDFHIDPVTYAAMFGLGAVGSAMFRGKKGKDIINDVFDEVASTGSKVAKESVVKDIAEGSLASKLIELPSNSIAKEVRKEVRKQTLKRVETTRKTKAEQWIKEDLMQDIKFFMNPLSLKTPQEIRTLADLIVLEGKRTGKNYQQILKEKMTNDSRYVNMSADDVDHISKMVFERFSK